MKLEATRDLFAYWNRLRGERTAPERCDIDPVAIRAILPDTFMLDVAADFPIRLAGTRVDALFDGERIGSSFLDLWQRPERHNLAAVLDAVSDVASPVVVGASGAPLGRPPCAFELLFLPLRHFGKTHSRILGIATPVTPPTWLGLAPMGPLAIRSLRVVGLDEMLSATERSGEVRRRSPAVPRHPEAASAMGRLIPGRPSLRLIDGGRAG